MSELHEVHLLEVPVPVWERSQEQSEALQREFALLASDASDVPARLLELVAAVQAQYAGVSTEQEEALQVAADRGIAVLPDLVYRVPSDVGPVAQALGAIFDEADEHCRRGEHLLTLAPDEELVRFRWWFLDQFTDQLAGRPAVPWPQYRRD